MDDTLRLLKRLIAIDSVNPSLVPGAAGEGAIARALVEEMRRLGLDTHVQEAAPGRPNVIGVLEGRAPGRSLMFCGHIDTVGVAGMARPFEPEERDGRIYGRGAQDMKSGVAAMIGAAQRIAAAGGLPSGQIVIACVCDEEHSSLGAEALVGAWRADAAIVTEPTDLQVGVAHKGFEWVEVETEGRAAHGSRPKEGRDAIVDMGRLLVELDALDRTLQAAHGHDLVGPASLHASFVHGGREMSSYPDRCQLQLERRIVPGESAGAGTREVSAIVDLLRARDPGFRASVRMMFAREPYALSPDHELPRLLLDVAGRRGVESRAVGMSFWTDAAILGAAGIPSVLFGPSGGGLHSIDEWVDAQSVLACRDVLVDAALRWCAG